MNKSLVISLLIVIFMLGIGTGYFLTPEYSRMNSDRGASMMDLGQADKYIDLRYIDGMIAHHLSAINMSEQALRNSERQEIKDLSMFIIDTDMKSIVELYGYKKNWYNDQEKITEFNRINLGEKDENFDLRFINAMIAHHEEAILVSQDVQGKSSRTETLNTASGVIDLLSTNIRTLRDWRKEWYGI